MSSRRNRYIYCPLVLEYLVYFNKFQQKKNKKYIYSNYYKTLLYYPIDIISIIITQGPRLFDGVTFDCEPMECERPIVDPQQRASYDTDISSSVVRGKKKTDYVIFDIFSE